MIAPAARRDLSEVADFIAIDSPSAALRVLEAIADAFNALAAQLGIGHLRTGLTSRRVRFWTVLGRYLVVYRRRRSGVEIVH